MTHADRLHRQLVTALLLAAPLGACDRGQAAARTQDAGAPPASAREQPSVAKADAPLVATTTATSQADADADAEPKPKPEPTLQPELRPKPEPTLDPEPDPEPEPSIATTSPPKPTKRTPTEILPERPQLQPRATCPSGDWCGVADPPAKGSDTELGCPKLPSSDLTSTDGTRPPLLHATFDRKLTLSTRSEGTKHACCYHWVDPCPGGRPLRDGTRIVTAARSQSHGATQSSARVPHREAAQAWLRDASYEYASVASFARAAIELMAVGAPVALVEDCQHAALDEVRHARVCAEIAWSLGAAREHASQVPAVAPRPSSLAQLAADTFVEGCVGETVAALSLRTAAAACDDLELRALVEGIADDEERHAALAWRTVRWALATGGGDVASALRAAALRTRPADGRESDAPAHDPELARCGRLDRDAQQAVQLDAWRHVIDPLLAALVDADGPPASTQA